MEARPYRNLHDLARQLTRFDENPLIARDGSEAPKEGETAIGMQRLRNLSHCIHVAVSDRVAGDIVETGVWRGGAMIFARAVLAEIEAEPGRNVAKAAAKRVWCFDSFEGLPVPDTGRYPIDEGDPHHALTYLAVDLETVKANFRKYGLLDDRVRFVKGWFRDTLPETARLAASAREWLLRPSIAAAASEHLTHIAVLRLDGDMYESTMLALENLYPLVEPGGFVIIDDWSLLRARKATEDYRKREGIREGLLAIDAYSVYWRKQW